MFKTPLKALLSLDEDFCVFFGASNGYRVYLDGDNWMISNLTRISFLGSKEIMIQFLLKLKVRIIFQEDVVHWCSLDARALTIQDKWRKYRLRTARDRNDLVIRGLAEYFGHPSRQNFSISDDDD
jgi:hypothetical protein